MSQKADITHLSPVAFGLPIITGPHIFKNAREFAGLRDSGVVFDIAGDGADPVKAGQALANVAIAIMKDKAQYRHIASAAKICRKCLQTQ